MVRYLPSGLLGLAVASMLAAFMSTVSTQVNWGASYLVNDLYARFGGVTEERRLIAAARWASVLITLVAATISFFMKDVGTVFRMLILIGNGPGLVLLLRWFWWRVNAWAELSAMLAGLALALLTYLPGLEAMTFGQRLFLTAFGSMAVWVTVMLLTPPEPADVLDRFYARVRPAGAWGPVRARTGLTPLDDLGRDLLRWVGWVVVVLGGTLGVGWVVLR
jgi:Na+/proline symporter